MIPLPIDQHIDEILKLLKEANNLVLEAEPGTGKTTRFPPAIIKHLNLRVAVLEPRRIAAQSAAKRIAMEQNWRVGKEVGYQVRFDSQVSKETKLTFLTEALLIKKLQADPMLQEYDVVVLDEFHERSLHTDIALGCLKELQQMGSPLKIVVMSATLDTKSICSFLDDAPLYVVQGKKHPLKIIKQKSPLILKIDTGFFDKIYLAIKDNISLSRGSTLVFLPGLREIEKTYQLLITKNEFKNFHIEKLYGTMDLNEQSRILTNEASERRIILSTNLAESSVTVQGVDLVIDSGLSKHSHFDYDKMLSGLDLQRISKSSSTQRAGRSARLGPGTSVQLWNEQDDRVQLDFDIPEIQRADLREPLLIMNSLGIHNAKSFSWFEAPEEEHLNKTKNWMIQQGLLDKDGIITEKGKHVSQLPLPPEAALIFVEASQHLPSEMACDIAAVLSERDAVIETPHSHQECDLSYRLEALQDFRNKNNVAGFHKYGLARWDKISQDLKKYIIKPQKDVWPLMKVIAKALPYRIARRRRANESQALANNGIGLKIDRDSLLKKSEFFVALQLQLAQPEAIVRLATPLTKDFILDAFANDIEIRTEIHFNKAEQKLERWDFKALGQMPLENPRIAAPTTKEISLHMPEVIFERWEELVARNSSLNEFLVRWELAQNLGHLEPLSDLHVKNWISSILLFKSYNFNDLLSADFQEISQQTFDYEQMKKLNSLCPISYKLPNSKVIAVKYSLEQGAVLESKLQHFFGLKAHPTYMDGKLNMTLVLLAPNARPTQITKDIIGFWKGSYKEVRKELRARYPKHSWPEDPTQLDTTKE